MEDTLMVVFTLLSPGCTVGILFCTAECLKAPPDLLKIYLHESNRVYRDKLVEVQDFQAFDKLQADTVKKFYEFSRGRPERRARGRGEGGIIRLPALCLELDISGQHSEEKEERRKKKECSGRGGRGL
ncbi:Dynein heavy chain 9, axonemal [Liparis tanakae]|uniref:Dynein heavy chain 9, axonemal n=1 Tax=Liparis tanakae TaxID=230148 RepID=A0A4Z2IUC8_9TELE|nr:Dynein heavy chain 9, axonemal [Liparis tanakae]